MLNTFRASRSNIVVWIIVILLIGGLTGLGITTGGGGAQSVAQVGDVRIEADDYARELNQELRAISTQVGRPLTMTEARQFGVDRVVLARLVNDAALDGEAQRRGLSVGDATVQEMVLATPAFRGIDGRFDREAYAFSLERIGLAPADFEELLRAEAARELIAGPLQSAVAMPAVAGDTLLAHAGETRRFDWIALDAGLLPEPVPEPSEAEIAAFYAANPDRYIRPETRRITYALLDPAALAATIEPPEDELRAAYAEAADRYDVPERRIADRIGFATTEEAGAALARLEAGEIDFDALAAERGLTADAIDQGELTPADLSPEAAELVFGAADPGVVGPVATPLGPSLYRINAILAARVTSFEDARDELRSERALAAAQAMVSDEAPAVDDLIAGGARIEEIVAESDFTLGTIVLDATTTGGLADDPAFRELADGAEVGAETDLVELGSGALVTLRVDAIEPPAPIPLEEARATVAADWTAEETARRLQALAEGFKAELAGGLDFSALAARLARPLQSAGPLSRGEVLPGAPEGLVAAMFAAEPGGVAVLTEAGGGALAQVVEIRPFDRTGPGAADVIANVAGQLRLQAAEDALTLTVQALQAQAGVTVDQPLVEQVLAQFP